MIKNWNLNLEKILGLLCTGVSEKLINLCDDLYMKNLYEWYKNKV